MILSRVTIMLSSKQNYILYSLNFYFSMNAFVSHNTTFYFLT